MTQIKIGIDLDNTIINYERSFKKFLSERNIFLKKINKIKIKQLIKKNSKIENWTEAQEKIYGYYIKYANLFKNYRDFEKFAIKNNCKLYIISHKTKLSQYSKKYNLRYSSNKWLKKNIKKDKYKIFYANTINQKIKLISKIQPNYYIDDLEKILKNKKISNKINKIFFSKSLKRNIFTLSDWKKIKNHIAKNENIK